MYACACMWGALCTCVYMYMCVWMCALHVRGSMCINVYVHVHACKGHVCACDCICGLHVCMYICTCVCLSLHVCAHVHVHVCMWVWSRNSVSSQSDIAHSFQGLNSKGLQTVYTQFLSWEVGCVRLVKTFWEVVLLLFFSKSVILEWRGCLARIQET